MFEFRGKLAMSRSKRVLRYGGIPSCCEAAVLTFPRRRHESPGAQARAMKLDAVT